MKWFKHYSDALDDPFIQGLMDEFGHTGYVVWFGLIETIAKENGNEITGKLSVKPAYLRRKLRSSQAKLREVFEYCRGFGKLSVTFSEKVWEFELPKMLEIKDNYTKDLQATGKKLSNHKEVEVEKEVEKERKKERKNKEHTNFNVFYSKYPKKVGRASAEKSFNKINPDENLLRSMLVSLMEQKKSAQWNKDNGEYIPNPSTWLNQKRWEDEITSIKSKSPTLTAIPGAIDVR